MTRKPTKEHISQKQAQTAKRRKVAVMLLFASFVVAGLIGLGLSRAANIVISAEAETGARAGNAGAGPTTGASGGGSVKFGAGTTAGCALPKYPDTTCTGVPAGTQLVPMTAPAVSIQDPNYVIDGKDVNGCLVIYAPNVVIKRSRINCLVNKTGVSISNAIMPDGTIRTSSLTIEDSEINCGVDGTNGFGGVNTTLRRVKIQGCTFAARNMGNLVIEDSLIHQMRNPATSTSKIANGIHGGNAGVLNARIQHNTIDATNGGWGIDIVGVPQASQVIVTQNYIKGGTWAVLCPTNSSLNPVGNITFTDNRASTTTAINQIFNNCKDEKVYSGNAYFETGAPIN